MNKFSNWLRNFRTGRRGGDQLSLALFALSFFLFVLSRIVGRTTVAAYLINTVGIAAAIFSIYRIFSRSAPRRERENRWFLDRCSAVKRWFARLSRKFRDRKTHVYLKCSCGAELRVPRGKGKLIVTCPKCRSEIRVTT